MSVLDWMKSVARRTIDNRPTNGAAASAFVPSTATTETAEVERRYKNLGEIARGGMGAIVKVQDRDLRRTLVMKVFDPEDGKIDNGRIGMFIEEAQINGQLDHPNICPVYEVGHDQEGSHFFTMKLVRGKTLADVLHGDSYDPTNPGCLREALEIVKKVCDALAFAHAKGVVHRDMKPENIMVGDFGEVYLMDWGIAKLMTSSHEDRVTIARDTTSMLDQAGAIVGTLMYMAPEQARGEAESVDHRADVFGLGAVLYEVLTQVPPYYAQSIGDLVLMAQSCGWRAPQDLVGTDLVLPSALCTICEKAMSAEPADRYQTVVELRDALDAFLVGGLTFPTRVFAPGECPISEGDAGHEAYIIQRGYCRVFKVQNGEQMALADLGPGDVFGETSVFADVPRTATVQALTDVTVQVVTKEVFDKDLGMASAIGSFVKALAKRFVATDRDLRTLRETLAAATASPAAHASSSSGAPATSTAPETGTTETASAHASSTSSSAAPASLDASPSLEAGSSPVKGAPDAAHDLQTRSMTPGKPTPAPVMATDVMPPPVTGPVDMRSPFAFVDVAVRLQALAGGADPGALLLEAIALGTEELARRKRIRP